MKLVAICALLVVSTVVDAQLVQVGPSDPDYCYKAEHLEPNLVLTQNTQLGGRIGDVSGEQFANSVVELRIFVSARKQLAYRKTTTDKDGNFNFGLVEKGSYRLLAPAALGFYQPEKQSCAKTDHCALNIVLQVLPTDDYHSVCPVR